MPRPLLALLAAPAHADVHPEALQVRLNTVIDRALAEQRVVGTVVIVMHEGAIIYRRAAGFQDRDAAVPMAENTIFRLASCSKTIVSAAALALLDRGRLTLDDPVTRWLGSFRPRLADGRPAQITLRQLLTH